MELNQITFKTLYRPVIVMSCGVLIRSAKKIVFCVKPQCARYASQSFSLEISKSIGKCENARNLKLKFLNQEFAYIFIVGAKEVDEKTITTKVDKDRRECYIKDGSFRIETDISLCVGIPSRKAVPAYLLIVEVTDQLILNLY